MITRLENGDLVADGIDIAVCFGPQPASSLVIRRLLETRILAVAAPRYSSRTANQRRLILVRHACIQFRDPRTDRPFKWEFHRKRKIIPVAPKGPLTVSDVGVMLAACLAGAGIAQVMALGVQAFLDHGR